MKINKDTFYTIIFFIAVFIPMLNNFELTIFTWFIILVFTLKNNYKKDFLFFLLPYLGVILIAFVVSFSYDYKLYLMFRDITYLSKPIMGFIIGNQLISKINSNQIKRIIQVGVGIGIVHLIFVLIGIVIYHASNVREIREYGGYFNDFEIYTLILLIFHKKFNIDFSKKRFYLYLSIMSISSFFYLARTNFIQFVIFFIIFKGWFVLNRKSLVIILNTLIISILSYAVIYYYNPKRNGSGADEFLYKIKLIPIEAFSTKINRNDWKEFNDHYRSYEIVRTLEQVSYNETYFLGEGIGSQVDLKQKVYLGDIMQRYISILHNGYMTVLLKSGIVGLMFIFFGIIVLLKHRNNNSKSKEPVHELIFATGVFLIISYWVFMGFYNLLDTKSILIGYLIGYKSKLNPE